jgi:hypothetical protein
VYLCSNTSQQPFKRHEFNFEFRDWSFEFKKILLNI